MPSGEEFHARHDGVEDAQALTLVEEATIIFKPILLCQDYSSSHGFSGNKR